MLQEINILQTVPTNMAISGPTVGGVLEKLLS